jgi:phosphate:Na+ symporter
MEELKVSAIIIGLAGGLALFLYGMEKLTDSLKLIAGDRMKKLLARMTSNRFKGVLTGATITATIQSSSVTTVLAVGFVSAGLLSLRQTIPIIMGAEIGTTVTAQIIAFKVTQYALVMVAIGFFMAFILKSKKAKTWGAMIMGLGLIFFGMELMKGATSPLRSYEPFIQVMQNLTIPAVAVLFSAAFTAMIQSSSATTGIIFALTVAPDCDSNNCGADRDAAPVKRVSVRVEFPPPADPSPGYGRSSYTA